MPLLNPLRSDTPVEDWTEQYGIWVKREDLSCPQPGPPFSKTRGVYAHVRSRPESVIGVLDTFHSQAGHAVAWACRLLGKTCLNFYPQYKADRGLRDPQKRSSSLGADLRPIPAGRSCILYHRARRETEDVGGYMMPNALKLPESIEETAKEARLVADDFDRVVIPVSSGTIAAGVVRGLTRVNRFVLHLGYSRSHETLVRYVTERSGRSDVVLDVIDEGYQYKDTAVSGEDPGWPCNAYYDLKAFRWLRRQQPTGRTLFWNVG